MVMTMPKPKSLYNPNRPYIIAEVAGTHAGNYEDAEESIVRAAKAGADAVKFQTFTGEEIAADGIKIPRGISREHDRWLDSIGSPDTLRDLLSVSGIPRDWHIPLKQVAERHDIDFLSTPFSVDAARFLVEEVRVRALKIASGDITFKPLHQYAASTNLDIIFSTGGSTWTEVCNVLNHYRNRKTKYQGYSHNRVVVMHCRSIYPCPLHKANLSSIPFLRRALSIYMYGVGYSDHTQWTWIPAIAVALGATVVEKHFSLDVDKGTADDVVSASPRDFRDIASMVHNVPIAIGNCEDLHYDEAEAHDRLWARRSPKDWLRPTEEARQGRWK